MRRTLWLGLSFVLLVLPLGRAAAHSIYWTGERNLDAPGALLDQMRAEGASELPLEALAYYRAGLAAAEEGRRTDARELLTRATLVDPSFAEAHLALARLALPWRPDVAATEIGAALTASLASFPGQQRLMTNLLLGGLLLFLVTALLITLFAAAYLFARLHHVVTEFFRRRLPGPAASLAAVGILASPFLLRIGLTPVILLYGGLLWPLFRRAERRWVGAFAATIVLLPLILWFLSPLTFGPVDPRSPSALTSRAMASPYGRELSRALENASAEHPRDPYLPFAAAMIHKRAGHLNRAARLYETSLALGGPEAQIHNNLGVILYHRKEFDEAIQHFQLATEGSNQAAPHYNLSQAYAKKLYFNKADAELREANRLAFKRVRTMIKSRSEGINGTLMDESLPGTAFWVEAWSGPRAIPSIPSWLRLFFPGTLPVLSLLSLPFFILGLGIGRLLHRRLPSFACTNCGRPISRRCLRRIRKKPYCLPCGDALLQIQSAAYSRLALSSRRKRTTRLRSAVGAFLTWLLPSYRAVREGRSRLAAWLSLGLVLSLGTLVRPESPICPAVWTDSGPGLWWPYLSIFLFTVTQIAGWAILSRRRTPRERVAPKLSQERFEDQPDPDEDVRVA